MKKLLIASTALSLAGGAAFAEMAITVSGDAELGVDYASEPGEGMSKHKFVHEVGIDFSGSGTTDGGLTFGGSAGFDTGDDVVNTGTVHVSGSFGKLTIGDNDAADLTAGGVAQIGMNDIGVDDMVEGLRGTTAAALRYDNDFGQIKIAISAGTKDGSAAVAAVPATWWNVVGPDGTIHYNQVLQDSKNTKGEWTQKDNNKPMIGTPTNSDAGTTFTATQFDTMFGVADRNENDASKTVTVDHDGKATTEAIPIHGFYRSETDGKVYNSVDNKIGGTGQEAADVLADKDQEAAFDLYEKGHDLGDDKMVGGVNGDPKVADTQHADTLKVGDNGVDAVPAVASDSEYAFGMSFNAGGVTIGVGYDSNKTVSMGAGFTTGEITTNLLYVKTEDDNATPADEEMTGMGVDMAYTMGASKVTLAYGRRKPEMGEAMDAVGMDVEHSLGGGATMKAGFGKVDKMVGTEMVSENKASIGLMFAF